MTGEGIGLPEVIVGAEPSAVRAGAPRPVLELRDVVKSYGKSEAVRGVSLSLNEGELLTLLGPSGSGKTTVLKLVAGFVEITRGSIFLRGQDVSKVSPADREIGMVFQNYALFPHMTVEENVGYPLKLRKWSGEARSRRVAEMLELVGLPGLDSRLPRELSGGQQQRVALARALAFGPSVLLMDEPLGALDRELRERMMVELRRIHEEVRVTALYVTHDREEALTLADRVGIMRDGLLEGVGTASELLTAPPSRFIASFFGGHALIPAEMISVGSTLADGTAQAKILCLGQTVEVPMQGEGLRAGTDISVVVPAPSISATPAEAGEGIVIEARVVDVLDLGDRLRITCSIPALDKKEEGTLLRISGERLGALAGQVAAGCEVRLFADRTKLVAVAGRGAS